MGAVIGGFVVFLLLAALLLAMTDSEDRAQALSGPAAIAVWFVYLIHADTVVSAAYVTTGRVDVIPKAVGFAAGIAVGVAGFALFAWATRTLVNRGGFEGMRATRLVTTGPYRFMRVPQNTGWGLMLLGVAFAGRNLIAVALVAVFCVFVWFLERVEDRALRASFGLDYELWRETTPLLPGGSRHHPRQAA
jgi:protein-S-isoprenylcysteine O-methyltransferase Ste14